MMMPDAEADRQVESDADAAADGQGADERRPARNLTPAPMRTKLGGVRPMPGTGPSPLHDLPSCRVGPVPFRVAPLEAAVAGVLTEAAANRAKGLAVHFANAYTVALADDDPAYASLLAAPDAVVFTDGVPVAWVGRRAYPRVAPEWERVYGPDVMTGVMAASGPDGPRHYLLGGSPATLGLLREAISHRWPEAQIVGAESPPFRQLSPAERRQQDERIARTGAQIVWVGLGTPKQDWEVNRLASELPIVAMAVGAAFDFLAGTKSQAPTWMQRSGTEWFYRLVTEPKRLGRRYLWGNPRFLRAAVRYPGLRRDRRERKAISGS